MTQEINKDRLRGLFSQVKNKGSFYITVGEKVGRSPHTVRLWFSQAQLTTDMPDDPKTLRIIEKELNKALK